MKLPKSRAWREAKGLTRQELAEAAGLSPQTLAGYESGRDARPNNARKLADALGVEVAELMEESQLPKALAQPSQLGKRAARANDGSNRYRGVIQQAEVTCAYWESRLDDEAGLSNDEVYSLASFSRALSLSLESLTNAELRELRNQYPDEDDLRSRSMLEPVRFRWVGIIIRVSRLRLFDYPDDPEARRMFREFREWSESLDREHV